MVGPAPQKGLNADTLATDADAGWLVDFVKAEAVGMGLRITYALPEGARLERLLVLGVRASSSGDDGQRRLEALLRAHHYTHGLAFVAQGTPTNNTPEAPAGYSAQDPGYATSHRVERAGASSPAPAGSNRQVTARALGVDDAVFARVDNGSATEQLDAAHMANTLWAPTWGYFLEQLLAGPGSPSDAAIRQGREHFVRHVRARGPLPALRIGNQPYGLLPVVSLGRWQPREGTPIDAPLVTALGKLREVWRRSLEAVPRLPGAADAETALLKILAMEPTSIRYVARPGQGVASLSTAADASAPPSGSGAAIRQAQELGLTWIPRHVRMVFAPYLRAFPLNGPLVEPSVPEVLSESAPPSYVQWLAQAPHADIRRESLTPTPDTLLYLILRHAVLREYVAAAYRILILPGRNVSPPVTPEDRREGERVDAQTPTPWRLLDRQVPGLTPAAVGAFLDMVKTQARLNNYEAARIAGVPADVAAERGSSPNSSGASITSLTSRPLRSGACCAKRWTSARTGSTPGPRRSRRSGWRGCAASIPRDSISAATGGWRISPPPPAPRCPRRTVSPLRSSAPRATTDSFTRRRSPRPPRPPSCAAVMSPVGPGGMARPSPSISRRSACAGRRG